MLEQEEIFEYDCKICYEEYNENIRTPTIICLNNHMICKGCAKKLSLSGLMNYKCPYCNEYSISKEGIPFKKLLRFKTLITKYKVNIEGQKILKMRIQDLNSKIESCKDYQIKFESLEAQIRRITQILQQHKEKQQQFKIILEQTINKYENKSKQQQKRLQNQHKQQLQAQKQKNASLFKMQLTFESQNSKLITKISNLSSEIEIMKKGALLNQDYKQMYMLRANWQKERVNDLLKQKQQLLQKISKLQKRKKNKGEHSNNKLSKIKVKQQQQVNEISDILDPFDTVNSDKKIKIKKTKELISSNTLCMNKKQETIDHFKNEDKLS